MPPLVSGPDGVIRTARPEAVQAVSRSRHAALTRIWNRSSSRPSSFAAYTGNNPGCKGPRALVKGAIQRSFRLISANSRGYLPIHLTYR